MKEKSVTLIKGKKEKANFSKIIKGGGVLLCGEFWSLLSKLMFTDSAVTME